MEKSRKEKHLSPVYLSKLKISAIISPPVSFPVVEPCRGRWGARKKAHLPRFKQKGQELIGNEDGRVEG